MVNKKLAIVWGMWGPYHYARYKALCDTYGADNCIGIALAGKSNNYLWDKTIDPHNHFNIINLNSNLEEESLSFFRILFQFAKILLNTTISVVFIPSYWPKTSFAVLMASKVFGKKCVMMNESHAGTETAKGVRKWIKKRLIALFDAGLIGGTLHYKHFVNLGMDSDKLYMGYDVIDNDYFENQAIIIKSNADVFRVKYGLPKKYILNLGRMVEKKNLTILISAYNLLVKDFIKSGNIEEVPALVLIGSGAEESSLIEFAKACGLKVSFLQYDTILSESYGRVYFGGFRQINENPSFYSLSEVFILPSLKEEWGLVVNEAMACAIPVVTSKNVGCAADLVIDDVNGFKFDPLDAVELMNILKLILLDDKLKERLGTASKNIIKDWTCQFFADNAINAVNAANAVL